MREIDITEECLAFINSQGERVSLKFIQLLEVIGEIKVVNAHFLKKLQSTQFYGLRVKAGNENRIIIFAIDHLILLNAQKLFVLPGFKKNLQKII